MSLEQALAAWDGKTVAEIEAVYRRYEAEPGFVASVVDLVAKPGHQRGATWLLKHYVQRGEPLDTRLATRLYEATEHLEHWESRLHVLQCVAVMPIPRASRRSVEAFVRECLIDEIKFVRAWAYYGFYMLAVQYPEHREEAERILQLGMLDEPASVKAR
ncbi:MAG: hypothetical protein R3305_00215, partial [Gammaproteobacteria bacterium]|nr:hypothetical protein [Gammaproteobacteria bacterium]